MATGLFAIMCPDCGNTLNPTLPGETDCQSCGKRFLTRFGYLIPVRGEALDRVVGPSVGTPPTPLQPSKSLQRG